MCLNIFSPPQVKNKPLEGDLELFFILGLYIVQCEHLQNMSCIRGMTRILHLISIPFPWFWHTLEDNANNLDIPTITRSVSKHDISAHFGVLLKSVSFLTNTVKDGKVFTDMYIIL
jgi:hypothetical protein